MRVAETHSEAAPSRAEAAPSQEDGECGRLSVRRWRNRLIARRSTLPRETRAALAAPLFDRVTSLFAGHVASVILSVIIATQVSASWPKLFVGLQLAALLIRVGVMLAVRRSRRTQGGVDALAWKAPYMAAGLFWCTVCGAFSFICFLTLGDPTMQLLVWTFALATVGGIASRNAGTPIYAAAQFAIWLAPLALGAAWLGSWNWVLFAMTLLYFATLWSIVRRHYRDVLSLIAAERANAALAGRFDVALSNMSQGLLLYGPDGALQVINRSFYDIVGLPQGCLRCGDPAATVVERCVEFGVLGAPAEAASIEAIAARSAEPGILDLLDGRSVALWLEQLTGGGWVTTCEDITERRRSEKRIAHMARHDALTGLPNRLLFHDRMDEAVARLGRGEAFALLYLDLDNFKTVNDALGHAVGDQLLRAVTDRLQACLREVDTVARLGGDEFAIILPGTASAEAARQIARRLIKVVGDRLEIGAHAIAIGVSIGAALAPGDGATADTLLMHADLALYRAKAEGRGVVCFYEPELSARIEARRTLEADILQALLRGEFELHYQPIVNLASMIVVGFEALVRWKHPLHGLVPPNHFIPLAEETGLIVRLGAWVLQVACAQATGWPAPVKVAVNLSPVQFRDPGLVSCIKQALNDSGLPAERLELEITEAAILRESGATLAALSEIRTLGVRIAFDDFGTGFSSLSYLHRFAFDKIKIDQSFIRDLCSSQSAAAIVRAIAGLGSSLRLITTAEGVETAEQMTALRLLGCTEAQGYLFSKPQPNSEVPRLLDEIGRRDAAAGPRPAARQPAG